MTDPAPLRTCATCRHQQDCAILRAQPIVRVDERLVAPASLPMPCGGDLWSARPAGSAQRRKPFAQFRPADAPPPPENRPIRRLDDLDA
jgi:hypothetical protein